MTALSTTGLQVDIKAWCHNSMISQDTKCVHQKTATGPREGKDKENLITKLFTCVLGHSLTWEKPSRGGHIQAVTQQPSQKKQKHQPRKSHSRDETITI